MASAQQEALTVSQLNSYIQAMMDRDDLLGSVCVRGELSNYKVYPSGHHYFTMKDQTGALKCVMFRSSAQRLRFKPQSGMQVVAMGRVTVYPRDGQYQLYCTAMMADGVGDLYVAFEQLKQKLYDEGLFDQAHKKPLPPYPHTVAIITSGAGAAVHDMLRILGKRYPLSKVKILPVRVQGAEAPAEIVGALRYVNRFQLADVILCGRGGGSIEDLWAFNDERVARAIYASEIPVVSAVGHEPDVTIADFVADVRAATPSNGAELTAPDQDELRMQLDNLQSRMYAALARKLKLCRQQLDALRQSPTLEGPDAYVVQRREQLAHQKAALGYTMQATVDRQKRRLAQAAASLDALSPLKVLGRGYGLLLAEDRVVRSVTQLHPGDTITAKLADGQIKATVEEIL
jgi:exodeoxyribonuclease VII large subunit